MYPANSGYKRWGSHGVLDEEAFLWCYIHVVQSLAAPIPRTVSASDSDKSTLYGKLYIRHKQTWQARRICFKTSFCWSRLESLNVFTNTLAFCSKLILLSREAWMRSSQVVRFTFRNLDLKNSKSKQNPLRTSKMITLPRHWARDYYEF